MSESNPAFSEIILVLLALGGLGVAQNPAAPPAAEVLKYAPEEVDLVAHVDVEAVVPRNYTVLKKLPDDPTLKNAPEVRRQLTQGWAEVEKGVADLKKKVGLDVVNDLKSVTTFVAARDGMPGFLVVARGKFGKDFIPRAAGELKDGWTRENIGGKPGMMSKDGLALAMVAADGALLVGSPDWVKERSAAWTPKAVGVSADARAALDEKPIFLVATRPRPQALKQIEEAMKDPDLAMFRDFALGQESFFYAIAWNGVSWSYTARTPAGYARAVMATDGLVQLMRAGHLALRGMTRVMLSALDSYEGADPDLKQVVAHKAELLRIVDTWSGDGSFAAAVEKKDGERRVTARLTGKTLSEVFPAAAVFLLAGAAAAAR